MEETGGGETHEYLSLCWSSDFCVTTSTRQKVRSDGLLLASIPSMLFFLLNLSLYPKYRLMHILNVNVVIKLNSETIFVKIQTFLRLDFP